ncbi:ABC transporter substrate-binding protein [Nesterenkonia sp. HG001]|uniref:ABC transporter substrate-binding protein n=1 Tax=Nesterenkonia sp. HG001 TaxID=2983207 RepID=UPI002AC6CEB4|nr:extracellular solute-binding protein [Nesterenkonia sp. HG001]MDZ5077228.1 extracellular solute-binding protein [Nesterenkonia sp. HG001]
MEHRRSAARPAWTLQPRRRRGTSALTAGLAAALALTACGGGGGGDDDEVTLRFVWWGSDARHQNTQEIIDAFEEEHPDITISGDFGDWDGYWDQLATQTAAADSPDIIQMDELYLREYADRGSLLDLDQVDTSQMDDTVVDNGRTEGGLYGITIGINAFTILANPDLFDEAGVEMPDDATWTWDDYRDIAVELSEDLDGAWGAGGFDETGGFQTWVRQQGGHLSNDEGELGFTVEDAESYFEYIAELLDSGATPSASALAEDQGVGPDQSLTTAGEVAMRAWWSNQSVALSESTGTELELLRFPSHTGDAEDAAPWYKSSMFLSGSAATDHPEEVQLFIDFFVNSEEAALIDMAERGIPPNNEIRQTVTEELEGPQLAMAEYIDQIEGELGPSEPVPAMGGSAFQQILYRYQDEVLFERMSPADAAEAMVGEMEGELR